MRSDPVRFGVEEDLNWMDIDLFENIELNCATRARLYYCKWIYISKQLLNLLLVKVKDSTKSFTAFWQWFLQKNLVHIFQRCCVCFDACSDMDFTVRSKVWLWMDGILSCWSPDQIWSWSMRDPVIAVISLIYVCVGYRTRPCIADINYDGPGSEVFQEIISEHLVRWLMSTKWSPGHKFWVVYKKYLLEC